MSTGKVLYLDFDGVLHPSTLIDVVLFSRARLLEPLFEQSHCSVVISSSWRFTHSLDHLKAKLPKFLSESIIGSTGAPVIGKHARYQEIVTHVNTQFQSSGTPVKWRALDDSYWEFPVNCKELIRCNPNTGVGPKEITQLSLWLENNSFETPFN
jgi:hypothetical protein